MTFLTAAIVFATSGFADFSIAFAYGISRAFLAPATRPMPPMVAPEGGIPKVIAMYSATWTGATILGRITIGRGSSIGGNVWLTRSVPAGSNVSQASLQHDPGGAGRISQ